MEDRFDSLNENQKNEVMNFLQITGSDNVNMAIHFMEMSNYDVSNAVNLFFTNQETGGAVLQPQQQPRRPNQQASSQSSSRQQQSASEAAQNDVVREYRRFLARKAERENTGMTGMIKRTFSSTLKGLRSFYNTIMPVFIRGETPGGEEFKEQLLRRFPNLQTYNFQYGTFIENLDKAHEKKLPLLIYFHIDGNSANLNLIQEVLTNSSIKTYVNKSFQILGLNGRTEEARNLSQYVPSSSFPCFACFRRSLFDQTELVSFFTISSENTNMEFYLDQLKAMKQRFFQLLSEDDNVRTALENRAQQRRIQRDNFIQERLFGLIQQDPQISAEEQQLQQLRIEEDRMLREAQEEAFREAERLAESQQRQKREEEQRKKDEENKKAKEQEERAAILHRKRANISEEPSKSHPEAFTFAFRVPDGSRVMRRFLKSQKIQNLFDFIECREEVEFESEERKFDLVQTFPALSLIDHLEKTINQVFPDSVQEIIIVKEL